MSVRIVAVLRESGRWLTCAVIVCALGLIGVASSVVAAGSSEAVVFRVSVFRVVDRSRTIRLPNGRDVPRSVDVVVRDPVTGGPHPVIVFAHGFALMPATYSRLLNAWAQTGYVVAAPVFPLTNANASGGPNEADLVNQPKDMSIVIDLLLRLNRQSKGLLAEKIDPSRIAIAGQSDGGVTALAVGYDSRFRDPRVRAAIILSGAEMSGMGPFPRHGPPLLAVQGTADTLNAPATTSAYFGLAGRPKFLLWLVGAAHLPPYTDQQPQLGIVERATTAFLDHYLRGRPVNKLFEAAHNPGLTNFTADP